MNNWKIRQTADLSTGRIETHTKPGLKLARGDAMNVEWIVSVMENGKEVDLSGLSCSAYVNRADGASVTPIKGTVSGNKCSVILTQPCNAVSGPATAGMNLTDASGGMVVTLSVLQLYIDPGTADTVVDPGHVIPDINELLAQIEAMKAGTAAANTAAGAANTAAGKANTAATNADTATGKANTAAGAANTAAGKANEAATGATAGAAAANQGATAANEAAKKATTAATFIQGVTVGAKSLPAGSEPTVEASTVSEHLHLLFGLVKGDPGNDIKLYDEAGYNTDGAANQSVTTKAIDSLNERLGPFSFSINAEDRGLDITVTE